MSRERTLPKAPSGIRGLDEITGGGLPRGRPTLVCGGAGCGKTLFAMEFLARGILEHGENGVFMSFEESPEELAANVASLGFDLPRLQAQGRLAIDHVKVERAEIEETGEYDLEGLFVRLKLAVDSVKAKRVVLDTVESLFSGLPNPAVIRSELRRLFRWLKDRGLTVVITGEQGEKTFTREGLEEYVSDCVIALDHRVTDQNSTRRLRVVKYRGSSHGTNEYPFLIDETGISVLPITSLGLSHRVSRERISSGIPRLDEMLGGKGYFRGSTVLVSGTAGTGKTSMAALLARSACRRGERVLYFAYEESADQIVRNLESVGIELAPLLKRGLLRIHASRPSAHGLEMHLLTMHKAITAFDPHVVVIDPVTNLSVVGTTRETQAMLTRVIDFLKSRGATAFLTSLTQGGDDVEQTEVAISSLIDTWLLIDVVRTGGERNRTLSIIKSRGMAHSNQAAEFRFDGSGLHILDTYLGPGGVLTGSAREAQEVKDAAAVREAAEVVVRQEAERTRKRRAFEREVEDLRERFSDEDARLARVIEEEKALKAQAGANRRAMASSRGAFRSGRGGRRSAGTGRNR